MTVTSVLDAEQELAASAAPDARRIVIAGPGAGKSEVVGERCRRLIEEDLYPEEILVISFSNVAVDVVRRRTKDVIDEGRGVDCATIDSLAGRVRSELEDGEPRSAGYDDAVARAAKLLEAAEEPVFPDVRHVIVDEVQDVVGVRAEFVLALLDRAFEDGVGFTLLGDPMQSLYDFQLDADEGMSSEAFLAAVRERYDAETVELRGEYRSRSSEARAVALARSDLSQLGSSDQLLRLRDLAADLAPLGELDEDAAEDLAAWGGTTALLCDTNARAGLVAAQMSGLGLPVELAAAAADPTLDPWIANLLAGRESGSISFDDFIRTAASSGLDDAEGKWRTLVKVARSHRELELRDLSARLRSRRLPPELLRQPQSKVVASTVHRAKGQEFDNVVLVDPESWFVEDKASAAAARRLFVAMSRARSRLTRGRGISTKFWKKDQREGVWLRTSFRGRGALGVILEPHHARHLGPTAYDLSSVARVAVTWTRADDIITVDSEELPSWVAEVDGLDVVRTGEDFGRLVRRLSYGDRLPNLTGGRVEGTETLVGDPAPTGPGRHGLWVGVRVGGPVSFEWE
ncbi:hypothetical protein GCM10022399_08900 [Terrabacter ginsenosidimutans]|uniref:UvrD-like helicase C-terminal domain-containing protein n=1 Tax=Terrabacter ginsenosidimutans TaxID=490575 RepID=A0ABP7CVI8_9MICO